MTSLDDPRLDSPAVRAKGTVSPSLKPMIKSRTRSPCLAWDSLWWGSIPAEGVGCKVDAVLTLEGFSLVVAKGVAERTGWMGEEDIVASDAGDILRERFGLGTS